MAALAGPSRRRALVVLTVAGVVLRCVPPGGAELLKGALHPWEHPIAHEATPLPLPLPSPPDPAPPPTPTPLLSLALPLPRALVPCPASTRSVTLAQTAEPPWARLTPACALLAVDRGGRGGLRGPTAFPGGAEPSLVELSCHCMGRRQDLQTRPPAARPGGPCGAWPWVWRTCASTASAAEGL